MPPPSTTGKETDWRAEARCLGSDPNLFFPQGGTGAFLAQAEAAKQVCRECAVRLRCLEFALETNQGTGVWGGTNEDERRSLRRHWVRAGRPSPELLPNA